MSLHTGQRFQQTCHQRRWVDGKAAHGVSSVTKEARVFHTVPCTYTFRTALYFILKYLCPAGEVSGTSDLT